MGWSSPKEILFFVIVVGLIFIAIRARHYMAMRQDGHDRFPTSKDASGRCADMEMFGFKFSVILALIMLNLVLTIYLIGTR